MSRWTFVRHGQSTANAGEWFAGHTDVPLTAKGEAQARAAASALADLDFDRVICSDLVRAHRTALAIVGTRTATITTHAALRERSCGEWEGASLAALQAAGALELLRSFDGRPPGGETLREVAIRSLSLLAEHATGGHVLVVGHGAMMRAAIGALEGRPVELIGMWRPDNCETKTLVADADTLRSVVRTLVAERPT
jgi:broad specificity phosphatase PhoE